jgi:HK97 family phage portal protein
VNALQRVVSGLASSVGLQANTRDAGSQRWWGPAVTASAAGQVVTQENATQHWAVRACIEALAGPISTLPMMVFRRLDGDKREVARDNPLFSILHRRPNRRQTAHEFRDEQQRHLGLWRNCYSRILPAEDGGPIGELDPIHPARVHQVERRSDGWVYYKVARLSPDTGHDWLREDEVWHIRKAPLTDDGLRGRPVWETDRETIGKALAVEQFGALYFANGGSGGGVLKHPGSFKSKEDKDQFLEAWRDGGTGLNRHRDRLLLFGVDYLPFSVKNDEAQFLETKKQAGYEVASIWNMPPHRVGMLERATNNNIEQQSIEFVMYTLAPYVAAWEQAAARDLLIGKDADEYFIEINVAGLLRGDIKTRWAAYALGRQWGWLSIDDVRRLENMDPLGPDKGGDDHLTPLNMVPAGEVVPPKENTEDA